MCPRTLQFRSRSCKGPSLSMKAEWEEIPFRGSLIILCGNISSLYTHKWSLISFLYPMANILVCKRSLWYLSHCYECCTYQYFQYNQSIVNCDLSTKCNVVRSSIRWIIVHRRMQLRAIKVWHYPWNRMSHIWRTEGNLSSSSYSFKWTTVLPWPDESSSMTSVTRKQSRKTTSQHLNIQWQTLCFVGSRRVP